MSKKQEAGHEERRGKLVKGEGQQEETKKDKKSMTRPEEKKERECVCVKV